MTFFSIPEPEPKQQEQPNFDSTQSFPGLGGGAVNSKSKLAGTFKHATHPKFKQAAVDPWAASGITIKKGKSKR